MVLRRIFYLKIETNIFVGLIDKILQTWVFFLRFLGNSLGYFPVRKSLVVEGIVLPNLSIYSCLSCKALMRYLAAVRRSSKGTCKISYSVVYKIKVMRKHISSLGTEVEGVISGLLDGRMSIEIRK